MNPSDAKRISQLIDFQAEQYPENTALVDAQGIELNWIDYQPSYPTAKSIDAEGY